MIDWTPGMFYDVGGAAALFWPDQHPELNEPAEQRWIVFDPWGGLEVIEGRPPRDDGPIEREMGLVPFLTPPDPEAAARALWAKIRSTPVETTLHELLDDNTTPKEINMTDDGKTLREQWAQLSDKTTCPNRLAPLIGSKVVDEDGSGLIIVELTPGQTIDGVAHLTGALASFFDLAMDTVFVTPIPEKARRIRIVIKSA